MQHLKHFYRAAWNEDAV